MTPPTNNTDLKALQLLATHHARILQSQYDESDVLILLILLREIVSNNSPLREIAHFIAHRKRDRGTFHQFVLDSKAASASAPVKDASSVKDVQRLFSTNPIYDDRDIFNAVNDGLALSGLPPFEDDSRAPLITCILSLLQGIHFTDNHAKVGSTIIAFTPDNATLLAQYQHQNGDTVIVPILSTANVLHPVSVRDSQDFGVVPNDGTVIRVVNNGESLRIEP